MYLVSGTEKTRLGGSSTIEDGFDENGQIALRVAAPADDAKTQSISSALQVDFSVGRPGPGSVQRRRRGIGGTIANGKTILANGWNGWGRMGRGGSASRAHVPNAKRYNKKSE